MKILVTRPEPGAAATARRLETMGHEAVLAPCLLITPRRVKLPPQPAAIIITSSQAIPALPDSYRAIPVFCVGDATAGRLREAGFLRVESAAGTAQDLSRLVASRRLSGVYLLAMGARHGLALTRALRAQGIEVERRAVYTTRPARTLPDDAVSALANKEIAAALFYSAETAQAFCRLSPPGTAEIDAYALAPPVAAALHGLPWRRIHVALAPNEASLLALIKHERD